MEYLDLLGYLAPGPLSLLESCFVLAIGIIFTRNLNTPVVKSSGECMVCYVILFCPFLLFAGTGFSLENHKASQVKPGRHYLAWAFTLCIAYILMKSLKILLAFSCDPQLQHVLKCCYKPHPPSFSLAGASWLSFALSSSSLQPLLWDRMSPCPESLSLNVRRVHSCIWLHCWKLPSWPSCASFVPSKPGNYLTITMRPNS